MLNIQRFVCNMFQENCYIVSDETNECAIIDCGAFHDEEKKAIANYVHDNNLKIKYLLCTHGHVDHNFGDKFIFDEFGIRPTVSKHDEQLINNLDKQAMAFIRRNLKDDFPGIGGYANGGDKITFGNHTFNVINTPGHTPGSLFFHCKEESVAFSGDTLFKMSIGRTDLGLGDYNAIINSLQHIAKLLPGNTVILPGHGESTTMADEVAYNPYFKTREGI